MAAPVARTTDSARAATDQVVKDATAAPTLEAILGLRPQQTAGGLLQGMFGRSPAAITQRQDAIYGELASTFTELRGPAASSLLEQLLACDAGRARAASINGAVPYGMLGQTGLLALLPSLQQRPQ